jgi:hypothetical protein
MPAGVSNTGKIGFLDNIRLNNGNDSLKNYFHDLIINNSDKAVELINDENLHYCSLYILQLELEAFGLKKRLNGRNRMALRITRDISARDSEDMRLLTHGRNTDTLDTLKWILGTGCADDGLTSDYEAIMEHTAILLSRTYRNTELLDKIEEMIFSRNRKGLFVHYLIWAFFEARSTYCLTLLANRLRSPEKSDVELAKRLLGFIPAIAEGSGADGMTLFREAANWIQENQPFLYYTGESLHQTGTPQHYDISREAKYLCSPVSAEDGSLLRPADNNQRSLADAFNKLDKDSKKLLSDCSYLLYRKNIHQWNTWMNLPIEGQIRLAATVMGGSA